MCFVTGLSRERRFYYCAGIHEGGCCREVEGGDGNFTAKPEGARAKSTDTTCKSEHTGDMTAAKTHEYLSQTGGENPGVIDGGARRTSE